MISLIISVKTLLSYTWLDNSSTVRKLYHGISLANIVDHWACFINYYLTLSLLFSSPCKQALIFTSSLKAPLSNKLIMTVLCHTGSVSAVLSTGSTAVIHASVSAGRLAETQAAECHPYSFLLVASEQLELRIYIPYQVPRRKQCHPTAVLLPGKSHGRRSLVGCSPWGR